MATFFTSDQHFGHENIISKLGEGRPFKDVGHQTEEMIRMHNGLVRPEDKVYFLGDIALGNLANSLQAFKRMNGRFFLVPGNHDYIFSKEGAKRQQESRHLYEDAGFTILPEITSIEIEGQEVLLSHFPYSEEAYGTKPDKFASVRPKFEGLPLLHGHTHSRERFTEDQPLQLHIGVDANAYFPVSYIEVSLWLDDLKKRGLL